MTVLIIRFHLSLFSLMKKNVTLDFLIFIAVSEFRENKSNSNMIIELNYRAFSL